MSTILEIAPHHSIAPSDGAIFHSAAWNSAAATEQIAIDRGHSYHRLSGDITAVQFAEALGGADALVWAAVTNPQPADETLARRVINDIAQVIAHGPRLHIVAVSHFLVGHGPAHKNAKVGTWTLRAAEEAVRRTERDWTIIRPTWLAHRGISSYRPALTQDTLADGLVTVHTVGNAVVSSVEQPDRARGLTYSIYDAAINAEGLELEPLEFGDNLVRDYEFEAVGR